MAKIGQKFAIEYCSYKGLTLFTASMSCTKFTIEYCSYKGLTQISLLKIISQACIYWILFL